jgi:hypothetical protein
LHALIEESLEKKAKRENGAGTKKIEEQWIEPKPCSEKVDHFCFGCSFVLGQFGRLFNQILDWVQFSCLNLWLINCSV